MRIAAVVSTFPPYRGGMGNVARDHVEALRRAGHEVTVFAPRVGDNPRSPSGIVSLAPLFRWGNAAVVPQLLWKLRGFDAVELHYPFFGAAEWVWLWKRTLGRRARLVVLYHMDTVGRGLLGLVFRLYRALFLKAVLGAADRVIVTSRDYLASSQAAFLKDDPRVLEVPLWVDASRFHPRPEERSPVPTVLFVGGLDRAHYFKGVGVLLEAFARVLAAAPEARLIILGEGDLRPAYERRARELGLEGKVRFVGKVPDDRHPHYYRQALFHVLPSTDRSEAFGLVTLEAAASGIPSVVSDLPGVRTTVECGRTGLVVPPGDVVALSRAMSELFLDSTRAAAMGAAARERAARLFARERVERLLFEAFSR